MDQQDKSGAKFTPGPWIVQGRGRPEIVCAPQQGDIARLCDWTFTDEFAAEQEANARLIASAPELYKAVHLQHQIIDKLLAMLIERDPDFYPTKSAIWPLLSEANAPRVLAKATGSQQ